MIRSPATLNITRAMRLLGRSLGPAGPNLNIKAGVISPSEPPGSPLIPSAPTKPIRFWFVTGDQDLFYPNPVMADGMHDWVLAGERMAKVLADKGYHYQFLFARNFKHVDRPTCAQCEPVLTRSANRGKHSGLSYFVPFAEPATHQLAIVQCRQCMPPDPKL